MTIGWYPGHMNKARKEMIKILKHIDCVIEILDARLPYSSENPLLASILRDKPRLKVLNKADLADPEITGQWLQHFSQEKNVLAVALDKSQTNKIQELTGLCYREFHRAKKDPCHIMIVGIPNVGKSTLLNILLKRKLAKVGNEPAVTKARQEIRLNEKIVLSDTPGLLWPKLENQNSAYKLAASGAIKNTAIEFEDVGLWVADFLARHYPQRLQERYGLEPPTQNPTTLLEAIAKRRGCLRKGGVDFTKVSEILINDLRSGKLGPVSFETPASIAEELARAESLDDTAKMENQGT